MGRQTVIVSVLANTSNFKRGMGDVASTLGGLGSKLGGMAKTGVAAVGAIGASSPLTREKHLHRHSLVSRRGLIPTHAGKTSRQLSPA